MQPDKQVIFSHPTARGTENKSRSKKNDRKFQLRIFRDNQPINKGSPEVEKIKNLRNK